MNPFLRNFTTLLGGNGLAFAVQLVSAPVLTRLFSPEDFGVYANVMAVAALVAVVGAGRFEQAIVQGAGGPKSFGLAKLSLKLSVLSCVVSFLPLYLFRETLWQHYSMDPKHLLWLVPLVALGTLVYGIFIQLANAQGQYRRMALAKLTYAILVALSSAALGWTGLGAEGLIGGVIAGFALTTFLLIPQITAALQHKQPYSPPLITEYKDFPRWNLPLAVVDTLNQQFVFNLLFTSFFGVKAMGWYSVTWRYLRAPARLVHSSAAQLFYREAAAHKNDPEAVAGFFRQTLRNTLVFALPLVAVLMLLGPWLFGLVLGEDWRTAGVYAQVLAPMIGLGMISGAVSTVPMVFERQRTFTIISISGQVLALMGLWFASYAQLLNVTVEPGDAVLPALAVYVGITCVVYLGLLMWFWKLIRTQG